MRKASGQPSPFRGIIFDLDGTLIDSRADIAAALNHVRKKYGYVELKLAQVLPMIGNGLPKLVERGFADTQEEHALMFPKVLDYYEAHRADLSMVYPHVKDVLRQLKGRFKMAIVSNKPSCLMVPVLSALGLLDFFDTAIGGEDFPERKPHPAAALFLLKKWDLDQSEVLMVGDMLPDAEFAANADLAFAHCRYGYFAHGEMPAEYVLTSFADLLTVLPSTPLYM